MNVIATAAQYTGMIVLVAILSYGVYRFRQAMYGPGRYWDGTRWIKRGRPGWKPGPGYYWDGYRWIKPGHSGWRPS